MGSLFCCSMVSICIASMDEVTPSCLPLNNNNQASLELQQFWVAGRRNSPTAHSLTPPWSVTVYKGSSFERECWCWQLQGNVVCRSQDKGIVV
ncbi:hypothetical protein BDQ94DRAFT_164619 [Aspergillus welwitschiae]|uniref:Secreted protein n=1 Tax=Aspergillus welwitschiae TaxID=1341132 RepID=A0A3F3PH59_9EURO|nr:hypothetical protein BDQ94DRAFT_164619 [Aspergillus welwitschiae]RDH26274.1 hypothetical protein BDQ94DRAFT_164619 [Aspergillus welwitschiae]